MPSHGLPRNFTFDALRGVAAIDVMIFHISNIEKRPVLTGGYLAVDFFFLLSGFVLWNAYGPRLAADLSALRFVRIRLVRLYPLFAIGLALGIARAIGGMDLGDPRAPTALALSAEMLGGALLVPSWLDANAVFPLDNPAWSLSLEVAVNIVFCLWMARLSDRRLVRLCIAAAAGVVAIAVHFGSLDTGWQAANYAGGPARCLFSFTLGVVMARRPVTVGLPAWIGPVASIGLLVLFSGLLAVDAGAAFRPALDLLCVLGAFPAILAVASVVSMSGWPARIGSALGEMSYPLYATHYPLILPLGVLCARLHISGGWRMAVIAVICVVVAAALIPVDRAIRSWLDGRRPATGARSLARRPA